MQSASANLKLQALFIRFWNSPTFTSWSSTLARASGIVLILPLVLTKLTTEEIALWYLFATLMGFQLVVDMGFNATFSRIIAFSMGGASDIKEYREAVERTNSTSPNWDAIERIYGAMGWLYARLSAVWLLFLVIVGLWSSINLINALNDPGKGLVALGVVIVSCAIRLYGTRYSATLLGLNKIALLKRWETWVWICILITNLAVLLLDGSLLWLVISTQSFIAMNVWINRQLCHSVEDKRISSFQNKVIDKNVLRSAWPSVWRSGIGIFMSAGLVQGSGIIYARLAAPEEVASYLLALNLMRVIAQFAQAPFYSKIPRLARLRAEGKLGEQVNIAKRGMRLSYWVLVSGVISIGLMGEYVIELINSKVEFVDSVLWALMGIAAFLERFGAMHLQLYSTTNHILWHVANGWTGLIYLLVIVPLFKWLGIIAFPLSQVVSNLAFYDWYSARRSYWAFHLTLFRFEGETSFLPFILLLAYASFTFSRFDIFLVLNP